MDHKKGIRIAAFVLDWFIFIAYALVTIIALLVINYSTEELFTLDDVARIVLQTVIYLVLIIATMTRQKTAILLSIVFSLLASTVFSFIDQMSLLNSLGSYFQSSWILGTNLLLSSVNYFIEVVAAIFFCASTLRDDGRKDCHTAMILLCCSLPFALAVSVLGSIYNGGGSFSFDTVYALFMSFIPLFIPLCYLFNIDGFCYPGKLFAHGQK